MNGELDMLPAFWMRRSRRARTGFRNFLKRTRLASPPSGERLCLTSPGEAPRAAEALLITLSVLCAAAGLAFLGEGLWIKAKAQLAQILLDRAFVQSIAIGRPVKPWSWADTWPIARISVPRLKASSIVLAGSSGQALAFGPGHLDQTPQAGERGTAVFAAHRDTHFRFLGDLKIGDEIRITRDDGITFTYGMTDSEIVLWDRSNIDAGASGYNLALATCWPLDGTLSGPLRYVVHAKLKPTAMFGDSQRTARAVVY